MLRAAVALADAGGVESLSMRRLAQELGVVPMALYKHMANKDELLDGMVDVVVGEIDPPSGGTDWKTAIRRRVLSARSALLRHPWASQVIESRADPTPVVLQYMDAMIGIFRAGGFSIDLTHHAMHAMALTSQSDVEPLATGGRIYPLRVSRLGTPAAYPSGCRRITMPTCPG